MPDPGRAGTDFAPQIGNTPKGLISDRSPHGSPRWADSGIGRIWSVTAAVYSRARADRPDCGVLLDLTTHRFPPGIERSQD